MLKVSQSNRLHCSHAGFNFMFAELFHVSNVAKDRTIPLITMKIENLCQCVQKSFIFTAPWRSLQLPSPRSSRRGRKSSLVTRVIATISFLATGGSPKVLTTESEGVSRVSMLCPTLVMVHPRPPGTCSPLVSGRFLFTTSR